MTNKPHPSHDLEWRDSSHYEYVCRKCNIADTPSGWGELVEPCMEDEKVKEFIGRSPDFADAIMMREYFDLKPSLTFASANY